MEGALNSDIAASLTQDRYSHWRWVRDGHSAAIHLQSTLSKQHSKFGAATPENNLQPLSSGYYGTNDAKKILDLYASILSVWLILFVFSLFIPRGIKRLASYQAAIFVRSLIQRLRRRRQYYDSSSEEASDDSPTLSSVLNLSLPTHEEHKMKIHTTLDEAHREHLSRKQYLRKSHMKYKHPSPTHSVPADPIIQEASQRLNQRGLRLTAHGIRCLPQRIWLRKMGHNLLWQTVSVARQGEDKAFAWALSPQHTLPIANIQYIDVGKHTAALKGVEDVPDIHCCSILTAAGSLDLQANSKTERDALVCVLLEIVTAVTDRLDELHAERSSIAGPTFV